MRPLRALATACAATALLAGCSDGPPPTAKPSASAKPLPSQEPRARLAGLVAAAQDHKYTAAYAYAPRGGQERAVQVALAADGTWRIDIPGGALGGAANISVVGLKDGVYQCGVAPAGVPATPPATPAPTTCVKLPAPVPAKYDVRIQHLFTDWLVPLTSRSAALSVAVTKPLAGSAGSCFSIESTSASLASPVDPGTYCYADDGTLTGARIDAGTLTLAGPLGSPPATVQLPGPVSNAAPLQLAALPAPKPSPTPSPTKR